MFNPIKHIAFASSFIALVSATFTVPRCEPGNQDPATGLPCTNYGYEANWLIDVQDSGVAEWFTVNGAFPPPITVNTGERIRITLSSNLANNEAVTLHFHGILQQNGYVVMDGPQGLTQSGVVAGQTFVYDFPCPKNGTFWIHSHAPGQYPKGIRSPLVVQDPNKWQNFAAMEDDYNNNVCNSGGGIEMPPQRIIINDDAAEWNHAVSDDGKSYTVVDGETHRFRVINLSAISRYYIYLADLTRKVTVIEIDGVRVEPVATQGFELASGQRISFTLQGAAVGTAAAKLIFLSDPKIQAGAGGQILVPGATPSVPGHPECQMPASYVSGHYDRYFGVQYAFAYIESGVYPPIRVPPTPSDFSPPPPAAAEDYRYLTTWSHADTYGDPWFTNRPKVPINSLGLPINQNPPSLLLPTWAWDFHDFDSFPVDYEPAWMVNSPVTMNDPNIHTILLTARKNANDLTGFGVMGLWEADLQATGADNLFASPESGYNSVQAGNRNTPPQGTTLMNTLQADIDATLYNDATYYRSQRDVPGLLPGSQTVVMQTPGEVHWFVLRSTTGDHPIHMHGHEFQLLYKYPTGIDSAHPNTTRGYDEYNPGNIYIYNQIFNLNQDGRSAPARRDTLMVEKGWTYVIAIKSDNPGVWAFHCHNDFHASSGMFMQLVEAPAALRTNLGTFKYDTSTQCTTQTSSGPIQLLQYFTTMLSYAGTISTTYMNLAGAVLNTPWPSFEQTIRHSMDWYGWKYMCYNYASYACSITTGVCS